MEVLKLFREICKIPHCSKKADRMKNFIVDFCKKEDFGVKTDSAGNILAKKGEPKICLQAHYDMVCVGKAPDIEILEEDGFLKAKDSSLGADNGMGVAMMLSLAKTQKDMELLFTADEEVGMLGAVDLELEIQSKKILNLDTEEEGKVYIGCAGGVDIKVKKRYEKESLKEKDIYEVLIDGLPGGHSGVDIDKRIPNAIKKLGYYLVGFYPKIVKIEGGEALNSIPKSAKAVIALTKGEEPPKSDMVKVKKIDKVYMECFKNSKEIVDMLCGFANGVREYDKDLCLPSLSVNLGKIQTLDDTISMQIFPRADDDSSLENIKKEISSYFKNMRYDIEFFSQYGAWKPEINDFSKEVLRACKEEFKDASYSAIHAGLECGVLLEKLGKDKMIASIGPNIFYPHSTNESCEIESVKKVYNIVKKLTR